MIYRGEEIILKDKYCKMCGQKFTPYHFAVSYCSDACKQTANEISSERHKSKRRIEYEHDTREYGKSFNETIKTLDELNSRNDKYISYGKYMLSKHSIKTKKQKQTYRE